MSVSNSHVVTSALSASLLPASTVSNVAEGKTNTLHLQKFEDTKERIRNMFSKVDLSVSSYDTAWVAMVPSQSSPLAPRFPECLHWLLDNQLSNGSWGFRHGNPLLVKDALSSTLACVLALKRWGIGEEHMNKGLQFIESNFASVADERQYTPIGFDIIFPGMIEYAKDLNLNLPLRTTDVDKMLQRKYSELRRSTGSNLEGQKAFLAYVSEGMGKLQDWEMVMKYQRKNGSLFNSPSATAAALCHLQNSGCLHYIQSLLEKFGNAVPTVYPLDIYARLCMVDTLEKFGLERHFRKEIKSVLDDTYRSWLEREEDIFSDIATCAMAFRLLRTNGFDVSSDPLTQFVDEVDFLNSLGGYLKDTGAVLELHKASQMIINPEESILEKQKTWTGHFLKQELSNGSNHADKLDRHLIQEADHALKFPYHTTLERVANRRYIERHIVDSTRILKTSFRCTNISNEDFLELAIQDFNSCQSVHRRELKLLERWVKENRLDKLKFARQKLAYCYFSAAATFYSEELSDARIAWAKNGVLTTVIDDFFDEAGTDEELANFIELFEKWDINESTDFCSEQVKIMFLALKSSICEIGEIASTLQGRPVTSHVIEMWSDLLKSGLKEAQWARNNSVPKLDEYVANGYVSFALGPIVLPAAYLVGPKLSEEAVRSDEYNSMFRLMSTCGRLLNDIQTFKREFKQGKLNAVSLLMTKDSGFTEEEAIAKTQSYIDSQRRELLGLILKENGSVVPRACKELFWKMTKIVHLFYMDNDGFSSNEEMINPINAVIHEPLPFNAFTKPIDN